MVKLCITGNINYFAQNIHMQQEHHFNGPKDRKFLRKYNTTKKMANTEESMSQQ